MRKNFSALSRLSTYVILKKKIQLGYKIEIQLLSSGMDLLLKNIEQND